MAQEYKIHTLDPGKEPFLDRNGNQWINVLFEGELGTPTKWVMRPESVNKYHIGDTVYGRIEQVDGKNYQRFYKEQQQAYGGAPQQAGQVAQAKYAPKDDHTQESIARSVALKAAVDICAPTMQPGMDIKTEVVKAIANEFLAWLQGSSEISQTRTENTTKSYEVNPAKPWERITKKPEPEYQPDNFQFEGNEYPIEDIPPEMM